MKTCLNCHNPIEDDASFCSHCGANVARYRSCMNYKCLTYMKPILPEDAIYCPNCGRKILNKEWKSPVFENFSPIFNIYIGKTSKSDLSGNDLFDLKLDESAFHYKNSVFVAGFNRSNQIVDSFLFECNDDIDLSSWGNWGFSNNLSYVETLSLFSSLGFYHKLIIRPLLFDCQGKVFFAASKFLANDKSCAITFFFVAENGTPQTKNTIGLIYISSNVNAELSSNTDLYKEIVSGNSSKIIKYFD